MRKSALRKIRQKGRLSRAACSDKDGAEIGVASVGVEGAFDVVEEVLSSSHEGGNAPKDRGEGVLMGHALPLMLYVDSCCTYFLIRADVRMLWHHRSTVFLQLLLFFATFALCVVRENGAEEAVLLAR